MSTTTTTTAAAVVSVSSEGGLSQVEESKIPAFTDKGHSLVEKSPNDSIDAVQAQLESTKLEDDSKPSDPAPYVDPYDVALGDEEEDGVVMALSPEELAKLEAENEGSYYDEVEIEDMEYDDEKQTYTYPCPCGDKFFITRDQLIDGEEEARCPSCSLVIRVIYDPEDFEAEEEESSSDDDD